MSDTIAKRIKSAREAAGLSIRQLAAAAGMTHSALSQIESGRFKPKIERIRDLASALNLNFWDLSGDAPPPLAGRSLDDSQVAVPLNRLRVAPQNSRQTVLYADPIDEDDQTIIDFAVLLALDGLKQPLTVVPRDALDPPADDPDFDYWIVDGQRRYLALTELADAASIFSIPAPDWMGPDPDEWPVPCYVVPIRGQADISIAIDSLIANYQRQDLTHYDEAIAFRNICEAVGAGHAGERTAWIAEAIGKTPRHVQQRLKVLRDLHPAALLSWRKGEISTAVAEALITAPSTDVQMDALDAIRHGEQPAREASVRAWIERAKQSAGEPPLPFSPAGEEKANAGDRPAPAPDPQPEPQDVREAVYSGRFGAVAPDRDVPTDDDLPVDNSPAAGWTVTISNGSRLVTEVQIKSVSALLAEIGFAGACDTVVCKRRGDRRNA